MMTREEIMKKLAEIKGKSNAADQNISPVCVGDGGISQPDSIQYVQEQPNEPISVSDDVLDRSIEDVMEAEFVASPELRELAMKWGADIGVSGKLINNHIEMSRKDYLKQTKTLTRDQVLADPLLYIMFRSEEQGEPNFFSWLERFPKAKNESK
jgi:hypothetical protein